MSEILIETYEGFNIEFNTDSGKFQCICTDDDTKESTSFAAVKKFIDEYQKKMDRQIKFRGWFQGINGQEFWVYGYLVKQTNGNWEITNGETSWTVDNVGQFTGLFDKNRKEIYEGDQLHICIGYSSSVEFQDGMFVSVYKHPEDGEIIPLLDAVGKDTVIIGDVF